MLKYWILAARPKTLFVSVAPVMLGAAFAYRDQSFNWIPALICLVFALLAQITSNFINDYFDHVKGTDNEQRLGPARMCASGHISARAMLRASFLTIGLALLLGLSLIYWGGIELIAVGALVAIFAFAYSGGPYPLSYHGWGDVAVLIFYGVVPVCFTYYIQTGVITAPVLWASLAVGALGMNLLIVNNYRDYQTDLQAGKKTTVVRFGPNVMRRVYAFNVFFACLVALLIHPTGPFLYVAIPLFALALTQLWRKMGQTTGQALNRILGQTALSVFVYALILSIGLF